MSLLKRLARRLRPSQSRRRLPPTAAAAVLSAQADTPTDWQRIGASEPFYAVLTHDKYLRDNLDAASLEEFWRTGEADIAYVREAIERLLVNPFEPGRALDFGCGVGRQTRAMAAVAAEAVGFDISASMVEEARRRALPNTEFTNALPDGPFDWINSTIVFQHIPPHRGYPVFGELLDRLAPGGVVSIHVTIFRDARIIGQAVEPAQSAFWDGDGLRLFRSQPHPPGSAQAFDYDLNRLLEIGIRRGMRSFHLDHADHAGHHGVFMFARAE